MLDIKFIRENPDAVRRAITVKGTALDLDQLLRLDRELVALRQKREALKTERNNISKKFSWELEEFALVSRVRDAINANQVGIRKLGDYQSSRPDRNIRIAELQEMTPDAFIAERTRLTHQIREKINEQTEIIDEELLRIEPTLREQEAALRDLLLRVPNIPLDTVPVGKDDTENVELRREGTLPTFDFAPLDQVELLERQGWCDFERVARVSGSRSYLLKGEAALLEMAVLMFALDFLSGRGLTPLSTTALVRPETLTASGHFPGDEESVYKFEGDELMLAGTVEVPINSLYAGEQLSGEQLPLAFAGISAAFRREAGSAGRDVRGLIRVHEFRKVEQYVLCHADQQEALKWFDTILANAEAILAALELPYRVVQNCTGDMGAGKVLMYDIETWVPSEGLYRETHSCSYLGDWQARRTGLRYRDAEGKLQYAHTLNNTGIASPRILVPLLENHQQADGTVRIPAALRPYLGGKEVIGQPVR